MFVSLPGFGKGLPFILKHPHDISERGDGRRLHGDVDITVRPIGEQRDLRAKHGQGRITNWNFGVQFDQKNTNKHFHDIHTYSFIIFRAASNTVIIN